jgi:hypothetical protein
VGAGKYGCSLKRSKRKNMPFATAAKTFGVPRNTLRARLVSGNISNRQIGKGATLSGTTEDQLVRRLLLLDSRGFGLTMTDVRELAFKFATMTGLRHRFSLEKKMAGCDWVHSFLKRNPTLSVRKAQGLSSARSNGLNKEEVGKFFRLLRGMYEQLGLWEEPGRIFNADETGLQPIFTPGKVMSAKGKKDVYHATTGEKGSTVIVMLCTYAAGQSVPPFVIMKGVRKRDAYCKGMPNGSVVHMSETGYTTSKVFSASLDHISKYKPQGRIPLIVDGHSSHCKNSDVLDKASRLGVEMRAYPPHTTHNCQPLDVSYFKSLKHFYNDACRNFIRQHPGRRLTKDFGELLKLAWDKSATAGNFLNVGSIRITLTCWQRMSSSISLYQQ